MPVQMPAKLRELRRDIFMAAQTLEAAGQELDTLIMEAAHDKWHGRSPLRGMRVKKRGLRPSMASVIREAVTAQPGEFTSASIGEHLKKHQPSIFSMLRASYISAQLWRMANGGIIQLVRPGIQGGPNTYVLAAQK
jgi:hypothetical protein